MKLTEDQRRLMEQHYAYIHSYAIKWHRKYGYPVEEFYDACVIAMIKVVKSCNEEIGKFSTLFHIASKREAIKVIRYHRANKRDAKIASLDKTWVDAKEKDTNYYDLVGNEDKYPSIDYHDLMIVKNGLEQLSDREKQAIQMYFFEGAFQSEIGKKFGVSQVSAGRIIKGAVKKIKNHYDQVC